MKQCARCSTPKPFDAFNKNTRNSDGLHSYCRVCQSAHYQQNRARHVRNVRRADERRIRKMRQLIAARFREGCVDCGLSDFRVLEFDHVRGVKRDHVSRLLRGGYSSRSIIEELAKCDVRCRNCHAIVTAQRRESNWFDQYGPW